VPLIVTVPSLTGATGILLVFGFDAVVDDPHDANTKAAADAAKTLVANLSLIFIFFTSLISKLASTIVLINFYASITSQMP